MSSVTRYVVPLDVREFPKATRLVGGKGAMLASMTRAGFPVPEGFVVCADAFDAFIEANDLQGPIARLAGEARECEDLEARSAAIEVLFHEGSISSEISDQITQAHRDLLGSVPVAVRSSSNVEDLREASAAGEQSTYLNVHGGEPLLEAVRRCWISLWSVRAIAYRAHRGLDQKELGLAVIVQRMVRADAAGVMFTVNPITGSRDELVLNANWGLGPAVVNGHVTPDTVIMHKAGGRSASYSVGEKAVMTVLTATGTADVPVPHDRRREAVLSQEQLADLTALGCAIEAHFGEPQDVEWAVSGGRMHVLQSRPVVAVPRPEDVQATVSTVPGDDDWPAMDDRPAQDYDLWTHVNVGEVWPQPVSPLMWSGVPLIVNTCTAYALRGLRSRRVAQTQWARRFYGRVYYNEGALAYVCSQELGLPGTFADTAVGSRRRGDSDSRLRLGRVLRRLPFFLKSVWRQRRVGRDLEELFPQVSRYVDEFMALDLDALDDHELLDRVGECVERFLHVMKINTELSISSFATFALLEHLASAWFEREGLVHDLVAGVAGVHSVQMGSELGAMGRVLSERSLAGILLDHEPEEAMALLGETPGGREVLEMLTTFLKRYGHHCPNEGEWLNPRWAEAPGQVLAVVAEYVRAGDALKPAEVAQRQRWRREQALAWVASHGGALRHSILGAVLRRTHHSVRLRENGKNCYMQALLPIRRGYALLGQRWAKRIWLSDPEDIFFLTIREVGNVVESGNPPAAGLDLEALTRKRREAFEYWSDHPGPEVIEADGQPSKQQPAPAPEGPVLQGTAVSSGRVRGRVRVILDPRRAGQLEADHILVTRATDPGWTPLFPLVAGVVVEIGGQLSHAAIVAREYGVPVVAGVRDATVRLREGQIITLDGATGCIYLGPESPPRDEET